jgi:chemotaxis protein methyltransferase CheR
LTVAEFRFESQEKPLLAPEGVPLLLRDIVHQRTGIYFEAERVGALLEKLEPLARDRRCQTYLDYYYLLKYEENGQEDWSRVMDALSVQETYFWREMSQVNVFVDRFIPKWFESGSRTLRVWSAACATGEEPYTIVMALMEAGWGGHPIEVRASDASSAALQRAGLGIYRENSFRVLPPRLRDKYFRPTGKNWQINPEIARRVTFERANLLAPEEISHLARSPFIFCRNVFIYFSRHGIRQTLATFASRMPRGGCLFVGAAESLLKLTTDFELQEEGNAYVYVRI